MCLLELQSVFVCIAKCNLGWSQIQDTLTSAGCKAIAADSESLDRAQILERKIFLQKAKIFLILLRRLKSVFCFIFSFSFTARLANELMFYYQAPL